MTANFLRGGPGLPAPPADSSSQLEASNRQPQAPGPVLSLEGETQESWTAASGLQSGGQRLHADQIPSPLTLYPIRGAQAPQSTRFCQLLCDPPAGD